MQTFLPYPSFEKSARCLDWRRLGKQRVEAFQIMNAMCKSPKNGWTAHPAVRMWGGHMLSLALYHDTMLTEWIARGYKNTMLFRAVGFNEVNVTPPPWFGNETFHASHRSNLLRKDPVHYGQFGWTESPDLPYVWPSKESV